MVPIFGILVPGPLRRRATADAPSKASFFGAPPDARPLNPPQWFRALRTTLQRQRLPGIVRWPK